MFAQERKELILQILEEKKRVTIQDLTEALGVSGTSVRTYLSELEQQHQLIRTHGGAMKIENRYIEQTMAARKGKMEKEKQEIAKIAVSYIQPNESIFLDTGTTCLAIAKELQDYPEEITMITNDLRVALELQQNKNIKVIVLGGMVRNAYECTLGSKVIDSLSDLSIDSSFLAGNGISLKKGVSTPNLETAEVKAQVIKSCQKNYLVMDHSKFEKDTLTKFANLSDFDCIFTDSGLEDSLFKQYSKKVNIMKD